MAARPARSYAREEVVAVERFGEDYLLLAMWHRRLYLVTGRPARLLDELLRDVAPTRLIAAIAAEDREAAHACAALIDRFREIWLLMDADEESPQVPDPAMVVRICTEDEGRLEAIDATAPGLRAIAAACV